MHRWDPLIGIGRAKQSRATREECSMRNAVYDRSAGLRAASAVGERTQNVARCALIAPHVTFTISGRMTPDRGSA
jgi:hypothetical protein